MLNCWVQTGIETRGVSVQKYQFQSALDRNKAIAVMITIFHQLTSILKGCGLCFMKLQTNGRIITNGADKIRSKINYADGILQYRELWENTTQTTIVGCLKVAFLNATTLNFLHSLNTFFVVKSCKYSVIIEINNHLSYKQVMIYKN